MKDTSFNSKFSLKIEGILQEFDQPLIMGILNATPDSFYSSSRVSNLEFANKRALAMIEEGADILDVGGYSSRPGAKDISSDEEMDRIIPLIQAIKKMNKDVLISVDTFRAKVANEALKNGAHIVNDITGGLGDDEMFKIVGKHQCPYILMHMRGTPQNMQEQTDYKNLISDISKYFSERISAAQKEGIHDIILDPGFGFSKTLAQNYELMNKLETLHLLEKPLLVGISRKSMIYKLLDSNAENALNGSTILNTIALTKGAKILRVHDIKEAKECLKIVGRLSI